MTWRVPQLWEGGECWILGGGPSLPRQFEVPDEVIQGVLEKKLPLSAYSPYMAPIHKKHVIGVNMAFKIGDWIDMVFWGDKRWYLTHRGEIADFRGLKVTCHPYFANYKHNGENIKYITKDNNRPKGISSDPRKASWNANSGAAAISVAANMGETRSILIGFDMKLNAQGNQHNHGEYGSVNRGAKDPKKLPFYRHLAGFPVIARDAQKRGITIINACPDSAIKDFPKMTVSDILDGEKVIPVPVPIGPSMRHEQRARHGQRRR